MEVRSPGRSIRTPYSIELRYQWQWAGLILHQPHSRRRGDHNAGEKAEINGGLQSWNFISAFAAALLVDKLGRRMLFIASTGGMLASTQAPSPLLMTDADGLDSQAFAMWTLTTALFETSGNGNAAKGEITLCGLVWE